MAGALVERDLPAGGTSGQYLKIGTALIPEWAAGDTVSGHAASHQNGGTDEIATATPGANVIPKAGAAGTLAAGFIPQATESAVGGAELATAAEIVTGTDTGRVPNVANLKTALASDGMWLTKRTKMPDAGSMSWSYDSWSDVSAITYTNAGGVVTDGALVITSTSGGGYALIAKAIAIGEYIVFRYKCVSGSGPLRIITNSGYDILASTAITVGDYTITIARSPYTVTLGSGGFRVFPSSTGTGSIAIDWMWCGSADTTTKQLYTTGTLSEEAARIADQLGDSAGVGVAASGTITSNGTNVSAGDTVTIAGKTYTFIDSASTPSNEGEIQIAAAGYNSSMLRLAYAVNRYLPGTNDGVTYKIAASHPLVYAVHSTGVVTLYAGTASGTGSTQTLTPTTGELGNSITLAKSAATLTLSGTTLSGGYSDVAAKIINATKNNIAGGMTRPAAAQVELTDNTKIGFETTVDVAKDATFTLPAGGTWIWNVYGYGATISSAKRGSSAGGTTLTVAGANASVGYRRYA